MADDKDIAALFDQGSKAPEENAKAESKSNDSADRNIANMFDSGVDSHKAAQEAPAEAPEEQGMMGKAYDFASNLPNSAIDLVPGMKDRRENIEAYRQTPEYKNKVATKGGKVFGVDVPDQTQGEFDEALKQSNEAQANDPAMTFASMVGPSSLLDIAKSVPGIGAKIARLAPKAETAASRLATEAVGMKPLKDVPRTFNAESGRSVKNYFDTKGTGTTALEQDVLPMTGGMRQVASNAQEAAGAGGKELDELLNGLQDKVKPENIEQVGDLGTKLGENLSGFREEAANTSRKGALLNKIDRTYIPRIEEIASKDGDLMALQAEKKKLYDDALSLSKNAYGPNAGSNSDELAFVQSMGRIVKEQIEKLAGSVDPSAGEKVKSLNQGIGHMADFQKSAEKSIGATSGLTDIPSRVMTGFTNKQLGTIAAAKTLSSAAKVIRTPAGTLVEQAPQIGRQVASPFSHFTDNQDKATTLASRMYNATDDSLRGVAEKLKQDPQLTHAAEELQAAIQEKDNQRKNNAIFLLLQKSATRKYLDPNNSKE